MDWDDRTRERLEVALNETDVLGVRLHPGGRHLDGLLHVLSLPESGPLDPDRRRILRLSGPPELRFLLRTVEADASQRTLDRPALPLAGPDAVEALFASLLWGGPMYGWQFFARADATSSWPAEPSLVVAVAALPAAHAFYWFNECAIGSADEPQEHCLEGTITFDELSVLDVSGVEIPIETFMADGVRQWKGPYRSDERLSDESQRRAQDGPAWRDSNSSLGLGVPVAPPGRGAGAGRVRVCGRR